MVTIVTMLWIEIMVTTEESHETVKYGHKHCGTRNQEWLCLRGPSAIYPTHHDGNHSNDNYSNQKKPE
jgi:hypothetical protein